MFTVGLFVWIFRPATRATDRGPVPAVRECNEQLRLLLRSVEESPALSDKTQEQGRRQPLACAAVIFS